MMFSHALVAVLGATALVAMAVTPVVVSRYDVAARRASGITSDALGRPKRTVLVSSSKAGEAEVLARLDDPRRPVLRGVVTPGEIAGRHLEAAILASEDGRFYESGVLRPRGLARALFELVTGRASRLRGASGIESQLAKVLFLLKDNGVADRTMNRKVDEVFTASALASRFTKQELLAAYASLAPLGATANGVEIEGFAAAAEHFFGKRVAALTMSEAATLAGLLNRPSFYLAQARRGNEAAVGERTRRVLHLMATTFPKRYSIADAEAAGRETVRLTVRAGAAPKAWEDACFGYLVAEAREELGKVGAGEVIETTIDPVLQRAACTAAAQSGAELQAQAGAQKKIEVAIVAMSPEGDILAMVGGRDFREAPYNRAVRAKRSPASTVKAPLVAAALDEVTMAGGEPLTAATLFGGTAVSSEVARLESKFEGRATLRMALAVSDNRIPAEVASRMGYDRAAAALARALGSTPPATEVAAMGAGTGSEVSPLALASAYTIFANGGRKAIPRLLARGEKPATVSVVSAEAAFVVGDMLRAVTGKHGTAEGIRGKAGLAAGETVLMKTGSSEIADLWAVAVTPHLITVVWVGCDKDAVLPLSEGWAGGATAAPVWARFARAIRTQRRALFEGSFRRPAGVVRLEIDPDRGCRRSGGGVWEYFLADRLPPACATVIASSPARPS